MSVDRMKEMKNDEVKGGEGMKRGLRRGRDGASPADMKQGRMENKTKKPRRCLLLPTSAYKPVWQ